MPVITCSVVAPAPLLLLQVCLQDIADPEDAAAAAAVVFQQEWS
ncbi:hypothetical protein [Synechococcus sp. CBW1004]|nr:hypothetical protein [Synechococcus sp. CBW1004]